MQELIAPLLICSLLLQGAAMASAADRPNAARSGTDADRQAFLAYKLRETGQTTAAAKVAGQPQDKQDQLRSEIEKLKQERKPVRTVNYGSTFGRGPAVTAGN